MGKRHIAYLHEDNGFGQDPNDSTYKPLGLEPQVEELSIEHVLTELGLPNDPETVATVKQQTEGAASISFIPAGEPWWLNHLMATTPTDGGESSAPYTYTWTPTLTASMPSMRLFVGADYPNGTAERVPCGAVIPQATIQIGQTESPRVSLTILYADEKYNESLTPGTIPEPVGDPLVSSSSTLSIPDSNDLAEIESGELQIQSGAYLRRGLGITAVGAASARYSTTLNISKALLDTTHIETAYGGTGSSSLADTTGSESQGVVDFTTPGDTGLRFDLSTVTPSQYGWDNVTDVDASVLEALNYTVNNISITASSSEASAK